MKCVLTMSSELSGVVFHVMLRNTYRCVVLTRINNIADSVLIVAMLHLCGFRNVVFNY